MRLGPREVDKLALHAAGATAHLLSHSCLPRALVAHRCPPSRAAGALAQKRLANGVRLNHPESVALIASQCLELIREGNCSVAELMDLGRTLLGHRQVLPGVATLVAEVQVEGTFKDGTKLVTIHTPINRKDGDLKLALKARGEKRFSRAGSLPRCVGVASPSLCRLSARPASAPAELSLFTNPFLSAPGLLPPSAGSVRVRPRRGPRGRPGARGGDPARTGAGAQRRPARGEDQRHEPRGPPHPGAPRRPPRAG